jgi:AcrR family transcriptional regulator
MSNSNISEIQKPWVETAYEIFAIEGPDSLKIESLSRNVKKNKSSFYHHFADLDVFTDILIEHHINQVVIIAEKEKHSQNLEELIEVILEYKIDLLFNRQLRINRENTKFEEAFMKTNTITVPAILEVWAKIIGLQENSYLAELVLRLSLENFYLQITYETLNRDWLMNYVNELATLVQEFKKHH